MRLLMAAVSFSLTVQSRALRSSAKGVSYCQSRTSLSLEDPDDYKTHHLSTQYVLPHGDEIPRPLFQIANPPNSVYDPDTQKSDTYNLQPDYYDALGNPISEKEYFYQVDYEQQYGIPYARDRGREKIDAEKSLSLLVHRETDCNGDMVAHVKGDGTCYRGVQGSSIFVNSLPSHCKVVTSKDDFCVVEPFDMIPILSAARGCYTTDTFFSICVDCRPLPA